MKTVRNGRRAFLASSVTAALASTVRGAPAQDVASAQEALKHARRNGLESKTIFGFGHINGASRRKGERLSGQWLRERMAELKQRYPQMPGVAFFQNKSPDTPELRELIRACDRLSAEFWPDAGATK